MLYTVVMRENKDFLNMYKKGRYITSKYSVIYVKPNNRPFNRFGITAGKKIGNAVARNRAKRLIRLAYQKAEVKLPVGIDIVIVAFCSGSLCSLSSGISLKIVSEISSLKSSLSSMISGSVIPLIVAILTSLS